jgi:ABC-type nitrate/sulfonate/bicarbonate transport system permease component
MDAGEQVISMREPGAADASGQLARGDGRPRAWSAICAALKWISLPRRWHAVVSVVAGIALWQLLVSMLHPSALVIVGPLTVLHDGRLLAQSGELWSDLGASMQEFVLGFAVALVAGVLAGVALGTGRRIGTFLNPWVTILYTVPVIALAPLFIVSLGIGMAAKVVVVAVTAFFPVAINTRTGVQSVDSALHEVSRAFRASRLETFRSVIIPGSLPYILTGVRLGLGRGLIALVFADLFGATAGLGYLILTSEQNLQTGNLYVAIVTLAFIGLFFTWIVGIFERRFAIYRTEPERARA